MSSSLEQLKTFPTVLSTLQSSLPNLQKIIREEGTDEIAAYCIASCTRFIKNNFPGTVDVSDIAQEFTELVFETRPDWKLADVHLFFKHIIQNPEALNEIKHTGNIITPIKLSALMGIYEESRSEAREKIMQTKFKQQEPVEVLPIATQWAKKLIDQINTEKIVPKEWDQINRETFEQYETYLLKTLPGKSKDELIDAFRVLEIYFSIRLVDDKKQIHFHFHKTMREIAQLLIDKHKYKIEFNKPTPPSKKVDN